MYYKSARTRGGWKWQVLAKDPGVAEEVTSRWRAELDEQLGDAHCDIIGRLEGGAPALELT